MNDVLSGEGSPITFRTRILHCELGAVHFSLVNLLFLFLLIFSNFFFLKTFLVCMYECINAAGGQS